MDQVFFAKVKIVFDAELKNKNIISLYFWVCVHIKAWIKGKHENVGYFLL